MALLTSYRIALALMAAMLVWRPALAVPTEYEVKAAFLFNFTQFVDWPAQAFSSPQAPIAICVLGTDPFGMALDEIVRGERVKGRALIVQRLTDVDTIDRCHVLFIDRSEQSRLDQVLGELQNKPTLTVADIDDFATHGGMVHFLSIGDRIRLQINLDAARARQLNISSKLLRAARVVSQTSQ